MGFDERVDFVRPKTKGDKNQDTNNSGHELSIPHPGPLLIKEREITGANLGHPTGVPTFIQVDYN